MKKLAFLISYSLFLLLLSQSMIAQNDMNLEESYLFEEDQNAARFENKTKQASTPVFSIALGGGLFQNPDNKQISGQAVEENFWNTVSEDPFMFDQIIEELEGDFFLGMPNGEVLSDLEMTGQTRFSPSLNLGVNITPQFEFNLNLQQFHVDWEGQFPITTYPFNGTGAPQQLSGNINTLAKGLIADVGLRYVLPGRIRPYVEAGARRQWTSDHQSEMNILSTQLPFDETSPSPKFTFFTGTGVRAYFGSNIYAQVGITFSQWLGRKTGFGGNLGIGYTFGRNTQQISYNPPIPPILANVETTRCECGNSSFTLYAKVKPRGGQNEIKDTLVYNSGTKTKLTFENDKVRRDDEITLNITNLTNLCTDCKSGECKAELTSVSVKSSSIDIDDYQDLTANAEGGYEIQKPIESRAGDVEVFIRVKYKCVADGSECKEKTCTAVFSVIFPRR